MRKSLTERSAFGVLLGGLVVGCGGGGGADWLPPREGGSVAIESFSAEYLAALCQMAVRCELSDTQRGCELGTQIVIAPPKIVARVQAGSIGYDPQQAYRCVQLLREAPCVHGEFIIDDPTIQSACTHAFKGTVPTGGACTQSRECETETCGVTPCAEGECCAGMCVGAVPARNVGIGGTCRLHGECVEGAFCSGSTGCQPRVPAGSSCDEALCQWDSVCLDSTNGTHVCSGFSPAGGSCLGNVCGSSRDPVGYCDSADLICKPTPYSEIGESCHYLGPWCRRGSCRDGVCQPTGILNEACTGTGDLPCEQGLWLVRQIECQNGICTRPPLPPDPCDPR